MVRAIIFDCFGVLTTDGWLPFKRKYFAHDPKLDQEVTDLGKQRDFGTLSYEDFIARIADMAGIPTAEVKEAIFSTVSNDQLFDYIADQLKPTYKLGILSNAGADMLSDMFSRNEVGLFDAVALSYETGHIKPDPAAYLLIAERLGVDATECVFVDDQERYCTAARDAGMQAIWYQNFEQFRTDMEQTLGSK